MKYRSCKSNKYKNSVIGITKNKIVRIHKKVEKFGIHEYQKIWYAKS